MGQKQLIIVGMKGLWSFSNKYKVCNYHRDDKEDQCHYAYLTHVTKGFGLICAIETSGGDIVKDSSENVKAE